MLIAIPLLIIPVVLYNILVLTEGATQADADAVQPNTEGVEITGRSVEDGVIRLELDLTDVDAGLPAPLKLVLGLPEQTYPGF